MVTGLTVNEKVNIPKEYWRSIKSMCWELFKTGDYYRPSNNNGAVRTAPVLEGSLEPLSGMLSHVYHVKKESKRLNDGTAADIVSGRKLHEQFWFYRSFVALKRAVIICEGETDVVYLRNAIQQTPTFQPQLGSVTPDGFRFGLTFFGHSNHIGELLRIPGGFPQMKTFMLNYREHLSAYKYREVLFPVIMLVDNDHVLDQKFCGSLKKAFGVDVSQKSSDSFYHLTDNLYLIKTPELGVDGTSCIEDLFDDAAKKLTLGGKFLHTGKDFDPTKHIGKTPFAIKVVARNPTKIEWRAFAPLLSRIVAVLDHYRPPIMRTLSPPSAPTVAVSLLPVPTAPRATP